MNRIFTFEDATGLEFEVPVPPKIERAFRLCGQAVTLRKLALDETSYDPLGKYVESVVVLQNHKANALKELFAFRADEVLEGGQAGGEIGYQLSNDGGATWLALDTAGPAWVPAVGAFATVYEDQLDVSRYIGTFPLTPQKQVRIRARLTPTANGRRRPELRAVVLSVEYDYDFQEDLARSLKHHLEPLVRVRMKWVDNAVAAVVVVVDSGLIVGGPVEV